MSFRDAEMGSNQGKDQFRTESITVVQPGNFIIILGKVNPIIADLLIQRVEWITSNELATCESVTGSFLIWT